MAGGEQRPSNDRLGRDDKGSVPILAPRATRISPSKRRQRCGRASRLGTVPSVATVFRQFAFSIIIGAVGESGHDGLAIPGRVVLAHEQPFALGCLTVHPALRQVARGTHSQSVEPRVMQVLVALGRADGSIVTRDELVERCWDGRIVGDDAINRVLSRIRQIASGIGEGSFHVETIARVGYRLRQSGEPAEASRGSTLPAPVARVASRRTMLVAGSLVAAAGAVGGYALLSSPRPAVPASEAKSLYYLALGLHRTSEPVNNRQAIAYLREAVRLSPDYGEAWGLLALAYRSAIENEDESRVRGFDERLREAVRRADRFAPGNRDAAAALLPSGPVFGKWLEYERLYRAAIERLSTNTAAHYMLGSVLMDCGRWADASASFMTARNQEGFAARIAYKLAISLWSAGELSAAEREIDRALQRWPQHSAIWQTKVKLLTLTGRPDAALAFIDDPASRPLDPEEHWVDYRRTYLAALIDRSAIKTDRAIAATLDHIRGQPRDRVNGALSLTTLGEVALALDLLEGVYLGRGRWAAGLEQETPGATHPLFQPHARPLWREPRFKRLLDAIGLERYWQASRSRPAYLA